MRPVHPQGSGHRFPLPPSLSPLGDWNEHILKLHAAAEKISSTEPLLIELPVSSEDVVSVSASSVQDRESPVLKFAASKGPVTDKRRHSTRSSLVWEEDDFSSRRITRSYAKKFGFKPVSAIPPKPTPLRRPRDKKPRLQVAAAVSTEEKSSNYGGIPPPTPIRAMQDLGASLGIAPEEHTTVKLMAGPSTNKNSNVSRD